MMLNMTSKLRVFVSICMALVLASVVSSCEKEDPIEPVKEEPQPQKPQDTTADSIAKANKALTKAKKYFLNTCFPYYYWHDEMEATVKSLNMNDFKTMDSFFEATLYSKDRWSWMADGSYYAQSESGEYQGTWGAALMQQIEYYDDYSVRVAYVYPGSPFARNGVKRGWTLAEINGRAVRETIIDGSFYSEYTKSPQTFTFLDHDSVAHTFTTSLASIETRSSLMSKVFTSYDFPGLDEPVGYFLYMEFKADDFLNDIHQAMALFKSKNIHKLILDLRYNGGGDSRASKLLVDYLAPKSADHLPYIHRSFNKAHSDEDLIDSISRMPGSLDLDALYVIGSDGTASASEVVINGLRPYMDLTLVGDTTYGKPNGMRVFMYPGDYQNLVKYSNGDYRTLEYVFLPICFFNKNGVGELIPEDGFIPDNYRPDDLTHDFGVEEDILKACLTKIVTGAFPDLPAPRHRHSVSRRAGAADQYRLPDNRSPFYGLTIEPFPGQVIQ